MEHGPCLVHLRKHTTRHTHPIIASPLEISSTTLLTHQTRPRLDSAIYFLTCCTFITVLFLRQMNAWTEKTLTEGQAICPQTSVPAGTDKTETRCLSSFLHKQGKAAWSGCVWWGCIDDVLSARFSQVEGKSLESNKFIFSALIYMVNFPSPQRYTHAHLFLHSCLKYRTYFF